MAMHQGFDLSRFKKISSDDKSTIMRHDNGHEIKIVHAALSPKMRGAIEALPAHDQAPVKMAKGGVVRKKYADPQEPVSADDGAPTTAMDDNSPAQTTDGSTPPVNRPDGIPPPPAHDDDEDDKNIPTIDVVGERPVPTAQDLDADDAAWQHDLTNGHIKPETYKSLFEKKDTLGKIGTLFGLMVGGAGSGLAHQPNMALEMMNRTIQNDLTAQTQNKHNATNYYNTAINMLKGNADIDYLNSQTALNKLPLVAAQDLADQVAKMQPGPYQVQAAGMLNQMLKAIHVSNAARNQQTEQGLLQRQETRNAGKPAQFNNGVNDNAVRLATIAKMPGVETGQLNGEVGAVKKNRQSWANYLGSVKSLDKMVGAGQVGGAAGGATGIVAAAASLINPATGLIAAASKGPAADLANNFMQERNAIIAKNPDVAPFLPSLFDFGSDDTLKTKMDSAASVYGQNEAPVTMLRRVPNAYAPPSFGNDVNHFFKTRGKTRSSGKKSMPAQKAVSSEPGAPQPSPGVAQPPPSGMPSP